LLTVAFANAAHVLVELVSGACVGPSDHGGLVQEALAAAVSMGREEPGLVSLFRIEVAAAIPEVGAERERLLARLVALGAERKSGRGEICGVAGALGLVVRRLEEDTRRTVVDLPGELASMLN
jgi:hypothetical protein